MTTFYVDGQKGNDSGNGSADRPWKTLGKANSTVKAGDEVRIRTGTYNEVLDIRTPRTTWIADTGQKPVIDGRYHDGLFNSNGKLPSPFSPNNNFLPSNNVDGGMVSLAGEGVILDGLTVQNVAAAGIVIGGSNCIVRNCRVDFTFRHGVRVNGNDTSFCDNVIVENCVITRSRTSIFDEQGYNVSNGGLVVRRGRDTIFRNNVVAFSWGEGINVVRGAYRTIVEGNISHTHSIYHIYNERGVETIIRNNLVFHLGLPEFLSRAGGGIPYGLVLADEAPGSTAWPYSSGLQIYNNIVVGNGILFFVNNSSSADIQLVDTYIGYNTFVGTSDTTTGVLMRGNTRGRPHKNSIFENNITYGGRLIAEATGDISGITFRNNLWGEQPPASMRGSGDRIGNPNLVNPAAPIQGQPVPNPATNVDPKNYQLTNRSTLAIGMASDGSRVNNLTPPQIRKDFFGAGRDAKPDIGAHEYLGETATITANFSIGPGQATGPMPHTVDFTDKSTSTRPIVAWDWDFGDGEKSTESNPSHTFVKAGSFAVSLTVTNDQGQSDKITQIDLITVSQTPTTTIPDTFRRFILIQTDNNQVLSYGTQYPDLHCVLLWNEEPFHILNYVSIEDVIMENVVDSTTKLVWIDAGTPASMIDILIDAAIAEEPLPVTD